MLKEIINLLGGTQNNVSLFLNTLSIAVFKNCYNQVECRYHRNRQGNVQTRTFEPTNESEDCWSAAHSYNFVIRVK